MHMSFHFELIYLFFGHNISLFVFYYISTTLMTFNESSNIGSTFDYDDILLFLNKFQTVFKEKISH